MSIQSAMQFIQKVRQDEALASRVGALGDEAGLASLVALAAVEGFSFTALELQKAHQHDWSLRWLLYAPKDVGR